MKLLKAIGWSVTGLFGLALIIFLVTLAVNRNDRPPSQAAIKLRALIDERPPVPDADNGYLYMLGFSNAHEDPQDAGARILAEIQSFELTGELPVPDEGYRGFEPASQARLGEFRQVCQKSNAGDCLVSFERAVDEGPLTESDQRYIARYLELLKRPAWREAALTDVRLPVPSYGDIFHAQWLLMLDLRLRARAGMAPDIRAALEADHDFWRGVFANSDQLLTKIVAMVSLRHNFFFGNLVLRELPASEQLDAMPSGWKTEFSVEELSLHKALAGELRQFESLFLDLLDPATLDESNGRLPGEHNDMRKFMSEFMSDFYQPQDSINYLADYYLEIADRSRVPLSKLSRVTADLQVRDQDYSRVSWSLYNPIGQWMRSNTEGLGMGYSKYPLRVAAVEGMRRAVLLTVQLRSGDMPEDQAAEQLATAELRNPFDDQPYAWDADEEAVVFTTSDGAPVSRHFYFY